MNKYIRNIKMYMLLGIEPDKETLNIHNQITHIINNSKVEESNAWRLEYTYTFNNKQVFKYIPNNFLELRIYEDLTDILDYEVPSYISDEESFHIRKVILWYFNNVYNHTANDSVIIMRE